MVPIPSRARRRDRAGRPIAVVAATFAAVLGLVIASAQPPAVHAADPVVAVPDEPGATVLDGVVYGALAADMDGDGTNELVTVGPSQANASQLAVAVWRQAGDGTWLRTGQAGLRRKVSPDERLSAVPHPDAQGTLAVGVGDAARLLAWHDGPRAGVLVAVNSGSEFNNAPPCCLTVYRVTENPASGAPVLTTVADTGRGAVAVMAADLDGDGTDELVVLEPASPDAPAAMRLDVMQWGAGGSFADIADPDHPLMVSEDNQLSVTMSIIGDSDGRPGVEIGVVGQAVVGGSQCSGSPWLFTRIALRAGMLAQEEVCLSFQGTPLAVPDALGPGRPAVLYGAEDMAVSTIAWPAGSSAEVVTVSSFARRGTPLAVLGGTSNPWVVLRRTASGRPVIELDRPDLALTSARGVAASGAAARFVDSPLTPYAGPWPTTSNAPAGFLFGGTLLEPAADGFPVSSQVAMLAGAAPVGSVGAHDAQMALLRSLGPGDLVQPSAMDARGGSLSRRSSPAVASIVPLASVLAPESGGGVLAPPLEDAIADPAGAAGDNAVLAGSRTFVVEANAPPGTLELTVANGAGQLAVLGADLPGQRLLVGATGPPFKLTVTAPSAGSGRFPADVFLVTPAGHGYRASFSVRVVTGAPALRVEAGFFSLGLDATVSGRTDPGARVVVDGTETPVAADGTFRASVSAGLTPRDVTVVARDPFGHIASERVSVLAPLDYRRLPWIPIVVGLTVAAGAVLFLRAPRPTARREEASVDEGIFEEVDPD
jgi:hypothetical protein